MFIVTVTDPMTQLRRSEIFIVSGSTRLSKLRRSGMLLIRIVAYNISLLRSSGLWVTFRVYKHSAPPELARLVAANGRAVPLWQF